MLLPSFIIVLCIVVGEKAEHDDIVIASSIINTEPIGGILLALILFILFILFQSIAMLSS